MKEFEMKKLMAIFLILTSFAFGKVVSSGATDVTTYFVFRDQATGVVDAGVVIANIDLYYTEEGAAQAAKVDATALAAADSAHTDNYAFHVGNGVYRIDWPDAAFDGANGTVVVLTALDGDGGAFNVNKEIEIGPPAVLSNAAHTITSLTINNGSGVGLSVTGTTGGMVVTGSAGDAAQFTSSGSNGDGIQITGNGTGEGLKVIGGATGDGAHFYPGASATIANAGFKVTGSPASNAVGFLVESYGTAAAVVFDGQGTGADIDTDFSGVTGILGPGDYTTSVAASPSPTKTKFGIALYISSTNSIQDCIIAVADASDSNKISFGKIRSITAGGVLTLYNPLGFTPAANDLVYITGYQMPVYTGRYGR